jgi:endonuclease/exonuclease/phosphatase family metal-dependent hydrolase
MRGALTCDNRELRFTAVSLLIGVVLVGGAGCASPGRIVIESPVAAGCRTATGGGVRGQPIRWIRPESPAERETLDAWCRGVGPAIVSSAAVASDPVNLADLAVITWNVNVGAGDVVRFVEALRDGTAAGRPITRFVLLLQEAYRHGPEVPHGSLRHVKSAGARRPSTGDRERQDIVAVAAKLGLALVYVPSMRNGDPLATDEDRGNAILSTETLSNISALELPFERQRRVAIASTVSGEDATGAPWTLELVNVHLDNRAPARRLWLFSILTRLRQARGLMLGLGSDGPAVVAGDFNTWYGFDDPVFDELATALGSTIPDDRRPTFAGLLRLDHIFFRHPDGWKATPVRLDRFGSDHHPLLATMTRPAGSRPAPAVQ